MMSIRNTPYGSFPENYQLNSLENLCVKKIGIQTGPFGSQLHNSDYVSIGTPILTVEHLGENRILHEEIPRVTDEDRQRLSRYSIKKGDIIFSRVGSVDRRALVRDAEEGWLFSGRCLRVRPDPDKLDSIFLSYLMGLPAFKEYIRNIAVGATMPSINTKILSDILICYPPLRTQNAIARILGSLDDKIELNRQMNETLEAMARAIFQSWFVDFDPVRAKAEGRQPAGMNAETAALFPDGFEEAGGREVPRGWMIKEIRDETSEIQYGLTQSASVDEIGPKFLRITDIQGGKINWDHVPYCAVSSEEFEKYRINIGDIFVARTGASTGENIFIIEAPASVFASYLVRFKFKVPEMARVIGEFMRTESYFDFVSNAIGGSAQPNASAQVLASAQFVFPTREIAEAFAKVVASMDKMRAINEQQSRMLAQIRDALLPKLMSGEIRVDNNLL
jgi:type I restriction enzyme S subunit